MSRLIPAVFGIRVQAGCHPRPATPIPWMEVRTHNSLPYFKFYVDRFELSRNVRAMNASEQGVYVRCLMMQWRDGSVPNDPVRVARYTGLSLRDVRRAWPKVSAAMTQVGDTLVSSKLDLEHNSVTSKPQVPVGSTKDDNKRPVRAYKSMSVSDSLSQSSEKPDGEDPTRAREVLPPPPQPIRQAATVRRQVPDLPSFHAFWERYRKLRDAGRQQIAAQMWISFDCEEHSEQIGECLTSYEASRDVANGATQNADTWLLAVFDSGFIARWPGVRTKRSKLEEMMEAV